MYGGLQIWPRLAEDAQLCTMACIMLVPQRSLQCAKIVSSTWFRSRSWLVTSMAMSSIPPPPPPATKQRVTVQSTQEILAWCVTVNTSRLSICEIDITSEMNSHLSRLLLARKANLLQGLAAAARHAVGLYICVCLTTDLRVILCVWSEYVKQ